MTITSKRGETWLLERDERETRRLIARGFAIYCAVLLFAAHASAQHEHHQAAPESGWAWSVGSNVFLTGNFQIREFRDFYQFESQNGLMGMASRTRSASSYPHIISTVAALTDGYRHELWALADHATFVGDDVTGYVVPANLTQAYERPASVHVYGCWAFGRGDAAANP